MRRRAARQAVLAAVGAVATACAVTAAPSQLGPDAWQSLGGVRDRSHFAGDRQACLRRAEVEITRPGPGGGPTAYTLDASRPRDEAAFEACMNARGWQRSDAAARP